MRLKIKYVVLLTLVQLLPLLLLKIKFLMLVIYSKKADYNAKISEMENKRFTTSDYNKFTSNTLDAKIKQKILVNESYLNEKIKTLAKKEEIKTLAPKAESKVEEDKTVKLQTYDLILFIGQSLL